MFEILRKIWQTGTVTKRQPLAEAAGKYRGKIELDAAKCNGCQDCVGICPSGALSVSGSLEQRQLVIEHHKCVFCGSCADNCEQRAIKMTNQCYLEAKDKQDIAECIDISDEKCE
ncbi:4Fe-4S binding protein [bacterium BFN5]|nr:4Fe-4S binding protein [bacterium BFN5]